MPRQRRDSISSINNGGQSTRSSNVRKRDPYVSHACDRCRAAKVRCNGRMPCSYCGSRDSSCHYTTPRFSQEIICRNNTEVKGFLLSMIQRQNEKLDTIIERISGLEKRYGRHRTSAGVEEAPSWTQEPLPLFQSLTSTFSTIRIMNANLRANDQPSIDLNVSIENSTNRPSNSFSIIDGEIVDESMNVVLEDDSTASLPSAANPDLSSVNLTRPLDQLKGTEIIRLIHLYQDLAGVLYPIIDVEKMEQQVRNIWLSSNGRGSPSSQMSQDELAILHMAVAIALVVGDDNDLELLRSLHDSVWPDVEAMIWKTRVTANGLVVLTFMCIFYYYSQRPRMAWRLVDNVMRVILELGLNQHIALNRSFTDQKIRSQVVNTIWTLYVLEQQVSYSLGISAAIRNLRIDPGFPRPVEAPYLEAMVQYARIGAQVCESLLGEKHTGQRMTSREDAFSYFQHRLDEWRRGIETDFQFQSARERTKTWNQLLRKILHLRANNLQLVVSRLLLSDHGMQGSTPSDIWDSSVDIAADTSRRLNVMDNSLQTTPFQKYRSNYFLIGALSMSFLALSQKSSVSKSIRVANSSISLSQTTCQKAEQTSVACLNLLYRRAETSRHARSLWNWVRPLATQLNVLDSPAPLNFTVTEDLLGGIRTPSSDEHIAQLERAEELAPTEPSPFIDINSANIIWPTGGSTPFTDLVSTLDIAFDPILPGNGIN